MPIVLQLTKQLRIRPTIQDVAGVVLRHYAGPADIQPWLELRRKAFARQQVGIGNWSAADFTREFLAKPWWRPETMWLATVRQPSQSPLLVGSVTLARRNSATDNKPVVHWLAVLPGYRRRGLGHLLLATLEAAVWDAGLRQVWLETHAGWLEANRLYERRGYLPASADAPSG